MNLILLITVIFLLVLIASNFLATILKLKEFKRLDKLNKEMYKRYKEVGSSKWAEESMRETIKNIVRKVDDKEATNETTRIRCQTA